MTPAAIQLSFLFLHGPAQFLRQTSSWHTLVWLIIARFIMQSPVQFCESLANDEGDISSLPESEFFLPSDWSPVRLATDEILDGGEIPVYTSSDAFSASFFENFKAESFLDSPLGTISPAFCMGLTLGGDSPASSFSTDGSSPILKYASVPWNIEDNPVVSVINPALIIKPEEEDIQELPTVRYESEHSSDNLALTSQTFDPHGYFDQNPLDLISPQSYSVINVPMKKVCRGRRVPTVEMVQKITVKPIDFTDKKPGRDTYAERRFVCGYADCRKCFKRREHLIRHQRSAHSSEKRKCFARFKKKLFSILIIDNWFSFQVPCRRLFRILQS